MSRRQQLIEALIHLFLLVFLFLSVNVDWAANWFDPTIRPNTPAPLSVLVFVAFFYLNAFWLIPSYFSFRKMYRYLLWCGIVFLLPELIRIFAYQSFQPQLTFWQAFDSRDSFFLGTPSPFFLAINLSFIYRFTKDWFIHKRTIQDYEYASRESASRKKSGEMALLSEKERNLMITQLNQLMRERQPFLEQQLSLNTLADQLGTTNKKLSWLLNQHLQTNFNDFVNRYRVEAFKEKVAEGNSQTLSIVGIASECGFRSKSSFYRAFKKHEGCSPSDYLKHIST
ncbi:MAG: helix-turn-helix domain-containing protein [Bacteroidota bacterium]